MVLRREHFKIKFEISDFSAPRELESSICRKARGSAYERQCSVLTLGTSFSHFHTCFIQIPRKTSRLSKRNLHTYPYGEYATASVQLDLREEFQIVTWNYHCYGREADNINCDLPVAVSTMLSIVLQLPLAKVKSYRIYSPIFWKATSTPEHWA